MKKCDFSVISESSLGDCNYLFSKYLKYSMFSATTESLNKKLQKFCVLIAHCTLMSNRTNK